MNAQRLFQPSNAALRKPEASGWGNSRIFTLSDFSKVAFVEAADRTDPVIGKVFKSGSWGNFSFGVAFHRIVNIAADALILVHTLPPSSKSVLFGIFCSSKKYNQNSQNFKSRKEIFCSFKTYQIVVVLQL
jgi:hypothetical protein